MERNTQVPRGLTFVRLPAWIWLSQCDLSNWTSRGIDIFSIAFFLYLASKQSIFVPNSHHASLPASLLLSLFASNIAAAGVTGTAFGFAASITGGGNGEPVYPADIGELTSHLTDDEPRVIVLSKEYNFIGSEGKTTENGCRPDSNSCLDDGEQDAINSAD